MKHGNPGTGAWTTRRFPALLGTIAFWAIAAIDVWFLWPAALGGGTSFVMVSGSSMETTYYTGDLVIARDIPASVGDVIVYAPESLDGSQIVHRIIGGNAQDGWVVQGDNNDFIDPFEPTGDEVKGVVLVHYSNLGRLTALLLNPILWGALILAGIVMLVWTSGDKDDQDEDDDDEDVRDDDANPDADNRDDQDHERQGNEPARHPWVSAGPVMKATAFVIAAVWAMGLGVAPAAAATASVVAGDEAKAYTLNACGNPAPAWGSTTTVTTTTSTQVRLSNIPAGCLNRPFTLSVRNSAGAQLATLTGTPTASTFTFTMPSGNYTVAQVATVIVKVQGWVFPTTWTAPTPPPPAYSCVALNAGGNTPGGSTCTISNVEITTWSSGGYEWANVQMTVTSSHINSKVTLDLSQTPFPGWTPQSLLGNGDFVAATIPAPAYQCSQLPILQMNRKIINGSWTLYFQMTTQPNAFPWALGDSRICP